MRNFRRFRVAPLALVCLGFTGAHVAWADPAQPRRLLRRGSLRAAQHDRLRRRGSARSSASSTASRRTCSRSASPPPAAIASAGSRSRPSSRTSASQTRGTIMTPIGPGDGDIAHRQRRAPRRDRALRRDPARPARRRPELAARRSTSRAAPASRGTTGPSPTPTRRRGSCPTTPSASRARSASASCSITGCRSRSGSRTAIGWFLGWRLAMSPHEAMTGDGVPRHQLPAVPMADDDRRATSIARCCSSRAWRSRSRSRMPSPTSRQDRRRRWHAVVAA